MKRTDGTMVREGHSEHCFFTAEGRGIRMKKEYPAFLETLGIGCE